MNPDLKIYMEAVDELFNDKHYVDEEDVKMLMIKILATKNITFETVTKLLNTIMLRYNTYISNTYQ